MSKTDEKMERIQEEMYWQHHERLNALLFQRLRSRGKAEVLRSLFSADALSLGVGLAEEKQLQSI